MLLFELVPNLSLSGTSCIQERLIFAKNLPVHVILKKACNAFGCYCRSSDRKPPIRQPFSPLLQTLEYHMSFFQTIHNNLVSTQELERLERGVKSALRLGYRHIDTARLYGSEEAVGRAIRECIAEGTVQRNDLYVTTKVGPRLFVHLKIDP